MFAAVPALYALGALAFAALAAIWSDTTLGAAILAAFSAFFIWCVVVSVRRSRGE